MRSKRTPFCLTTASGAIFIAVIAILNACSDGGGIIPDARIATDSQTDTGPCVLSIATINGTDAKMVSNLTAANDQNPARYGIQLDIEVIATNITAGDQVTLDVTRVSPSISAGVTEGRAIFSDVTVDSELTQVALRAIANNCQFDEKLLAVDSGPECVFVTPVDGGDTPVNVPGAVLGLAQDKQSDDELFTYDIVVRTFEAAGGNVKLTVDDQVRDTLDVGDDGTVTFSDSALPNGTVALSAELSVGDVTRTCTATISVNSNLPSCNIKIDPEHVSTLDGTYNAAGVAQDVDTAPGFQTDITVATEARVDKVTLFVDDIQVAHLAPSQNTAIFAAYTLEDTGSAATATPRRLTARCLDEQTGDIRRADLALIIDSEAPPAVSDLSCTMTDRRNGEVSCQWTTVGTGADEYHIRSVSAAPTTTPTLTLTDSNWNTAEPRAKETAIAAADRTQTATIDSLAFPRTYVMGIRAMDNARNASAIDLSSEGSAIVIDYKRSTIVGSSEDSGVGQSIASGDFDCDGDTDLAVGDPAANGGKGRVFIYLGTSGGYTSSIKQIAGTGADGGFGTKLAALPNFGGSDACNDLAVYAPYGNTSDGKVYVYLGRSSFSDRTDSSTGTGADLILSLPLAATNQRIGEGLFSAGDFDNDGLTDLAVTHRAIGATTANVLVVKGEAVPKVGIDTTTPTLRELPSSAMVSIGDIPIDNGTGADVAFAAAGSLTTGDDFADLIVGAPRANNDAGGIGKVFVVKGEATPPSTISVNETSGRVITISGGATNAAFGKQVAVVGDMVGGDSLIEFAVSDTTVNDGAGAVYVFNLAEAALPTTVADAIVDITNDVSNARNNGLGVALAHAGPLGANGGDLNKDGFADLIVAARAMGTNTQGVVFAFLGSEAATDRVVSGADYVFMAPTGGVAFGRTLEWINDLNRDTYNDIAIGDPQESDGFGKVTAFY